MKKLLARGARSVRVTLVASVGVVALGAAIAWAVGLWPNLPIVGGAAYCQSFMMNPTTGLPTTTCNGPTTPAGPTVVTGNELVPADTRLSGGRAPQTVLLSMASLNALPYDYQLLVTGALNYTYTVPNTSGLVEFDMASGPISDVRATAPAAPIDGQRVKINSRVTITAFQFIANTGQTLAATTPTVLTASTTAPQGYEWFYRSTDAKWYRVQ